MSGRIRAFSWGSRSIAVEAFYQKLMASGSGGRDRAMRWSERFAFREKVHERYPEVWDLKLVRKRLPYISSCIRERRVCS